MTTKHPAPDAGTVPEFSLNTKWGDSFTVHQSYNTGMVGLVAQDFEGDCDLTPDEADAIAAALQAHARAARERGGE